MVAFVAIGVRLFDIQARDRGHLRSLGIGQRVQTLELPAERGGIFDRTGRDLAVSVSQTTITADPRVIVDPIGSAAKLASILHIDEGALLGRLANPKSAFAYVARKVDNNMAKQVRHLHLPGISFVDESKRFYPSGSVAAPMLGFVGTDNTGLGGLEYLYEKPLRGSAGEVQVERDPQGNDIPGGHHQVRAAQRGSDLVLTVDQSLQWNTEQALAQQVVAAHARGGTAVIADVRSGDILAMATVDGATDTLPAHAADSSERNRPVTDMYEPGSTNKVITMAAAIQEGLVSPDTVIDGVGQTINIGGTEYQDVEDHPSSMSVTDILAQSSNVGTIKIASELGKQRFDRYVRAFGFGRRTALDLPGEERGILLPLGDYNDTSMGSIPIGNGIAVTAMQMLDVYMTIANNGLSRPPRLVAATVDAAGIRHDVPLGAPDQVVSAATAKAVSGMLQQVVETGTGGKAAVAGYSVAGKTGTARKPPYEHPPYKYVASFAGFAPADSPRLAAIVVLDEPQGVSYFASDVAAPVFSQIMQFALTYERVPTNR